MEFSYYEAGDGKNSSDTTGALFKRLYENGVTKPKNPSHENSRSPDDVKIVESNLDTDCENLEFIHFEAFAPFERDQNPKSPLPGIRDLHSFLRMMAL